MKRLLPFLILAISSKHILGQISIGAKIDANESTLLLFAGMANNNSIETTNTKGIILPAVETRPNFNTWAQQEANNGTFVFEKSSKKVLMYQNRRWEELSDTIGRIDQLPTNNSAEKGKGVIIGATTTQAKGVLVLESDSKALILPHIKRPHENVRSPYPGMICYDTASNSLAVFDGAVWHYWK